MSVQPLQQTPKLPQPCAQCGRTMVAGSTLYTIIGYPETLYCSRACTDEAFYDLKHKRKKPQSNYQERDMRVPAEDFGRAGLTREVCDNPNCRKPLKTPCWGGRDGHYCSNECLIVTEKPDLLGETKMNANVETTETNSPVQGSTTTKKAPAKKAAAKKAAAKAAPAKGKKAAEPTSNGRSKFADDQTIHLTKEFDASAFRGSRGERAKKLKDGMTVEAFKAAVDKVGDIGSATGLLGLLVQEGKVRVK